MNHSKAKAKIIELFEKNVLGQIPDPIEMQNNHDGSEGHWLEKRMGIDPNGDNSADLMGYEMKNHTTSKTSFGDWSADWYLFNHKGNKESKLVRDDFLSIFGKPNEKKNGRCSWSGEPCPTVKGYNSFGQKLVIDKDKSIIAVYSYSKDQRENKSQIVPVEYQKENFTIAKWERASIQKKLERKFNQNGWFKCLKNSTGQYYRISFGKPMNYDE